MNVSIILGILAALAAVATFEGLWWSLQRRKSPAERERLRRLAVNATGRITDGVLLEAPTAQNLSANSEWVFYRYSASGVEHTAAQDVSSLRRLIRPGTCRPGTMTAVKYDPRRPSNSIVVCELWSGLREERDGAQAKPQPDPLPRGG